MFSSVESFKKLSYWCQGGGRVFKSKSILRGSCVVDSDCSYESRKCDEINTVGLGVLTTLVGQN